MTFAGDKLFSNLQFESREAGETGRRANTSFSTKSCRRDQAAKFEGDVNKNCTGQPVVLQPGSHVTRLNMWVTRMGCFTGSPV